MARSSSTTVPNPKERAGHLRAISTEHPEVLACSRHLLTVEPFTIRRYGQAFVLSERLTIDLRQVRAGDYRVVAVHNFHVEDDGVDLDRCIAGVFLAGRVGDGWEDPHRYPVECRTVGVLAELEVR